MKISVIIPVKNRASLLAVTLNNILGQSLKPYEVIVIDDGSSDNIQDVITEFKSSVVFLNSTGKGPGAARNTGLQIATGNAIQFFDSDDLMTENKLEVQAQLLNESKADFIYGPWVKASNENNVWKQLDVIMQYYPIPNGLMKNHVLQGWCNITQSALFSHDLIKEVGLWREDLVTHEDYEYWFRIGKVTKHYIHENKTCVIYRQHQEQITDLQVAEKRKWQNEFHALNLIRQGLDYKPDLHSLRMFNGKELYAKLSYIKKFGDEDIQLVKKNSLLFMYFKLFNKLGRIETGTPWQKMHGVLPMGNNRFEEYIKDVRMFLETSHATIN